MEIDCQYRPDFNNRFSHQIYHQQNRMLEDHYLRQLDSTQSKHSSDDLENIRINFIKE